MNMNSCNFHSCKNFNVQQQILLDQGIDILCNTVSLHYLHSSLHHPIRIHNCCFHRHTSHHLSIEVNHSYLCMELQL